MAKFSCDLLALLAESKAATKNAKTVFGNLESLDLFSLNLLQVVGHTIDRCITRTDKTTLVARAVAKSSLCPRIRVSACMVR